MTLVGGMRSLLPTILAGLLLAAHAAAQPRVKLSAETAAAFDSYVKDADVVLKKRLDGELSFLWMDEDPERRPKVRDGRILIENLGMKSEKIKGGLLHVWLGAAFFPDATGPQILGVLQDYDRHQDWYPEVVKSKLLGRDGEILRGYQRLLKKKVLTAVLNTEHQARYRQISEQRWAGESLSTKIAEVEKAGEPGEKELPVGDDSGFLWRLNVYWSIEETEGGAVVECLTISLSRQIPFGLGWLIKPFVTSLPRESLEGTLQATRLAVKGAGGGE